MKVASWMTCVVVAGALAFGCTVAMAAEGEGKKGDKAGAAAAVELSKAAADAIKAAFPAATQKGAPRMNKDKSFNVTLAEGKTEFQVAVTDAGVVLSVTSKVAAADLPKAVADAAAAALAGGMVTGATKMEQRADAATLAKLDKPTVSYVVSLAKDDTKGSTTIGEDGKVIRPFEAKQAKPAGEKKEKAK